MRLQFSLSSNAGADSGARWNQSKRGSAESQQQRTVPTVPSGCARMHTSRELSSRTAQPHGLRNSGAPVRESLGRNRLPPNERPSGWLKVPPADTRTVELQLPAIDFRTRPTAGSTLVLGLVDSERRASRTPTMSFNCIIRDLLLQERNLGEGSYGL